jgi:hypothetical protein
MSEDCDHIFGNMAPSPRHCMRCGMKEFDAVVAPELDKILRDAHEKLKYARVTPTKKAGRE